MAVDHNKPPCEECHSYDDERHGVECSKTPLDRKIEMYKYALQRAHEVEKRNHAAYVRLREQVTMWQGKFKAVKHENNALRKKLRRQQRADAGRGDTDDAICQREGEEETPSYGT